MRAPAGAVVRRAGRSWRVQPGRPIRLLDGDLVEIDGRHHVVDLDDEPEGRASDVARHAHGAAALALAAFLGVTSPVSAETPAPAVAAQQAGADENAGKAPARTGAHDGKITGTVLFAGSKQPVVGVAVIARGEQGDERSGETDRRGAFVIDGLRPGKYNVRVVPSAAVATVQEREARVKAGATVNVALTAQRATLRFHWHGGSKAAVPKTLPEKK